MLQIMSSINGFWLLRIMKIFVILKSFYNGTSMAQKHNVYKINSEINDCRILCDYSMSKHMLLFPIDTEIGKAFLWFNVRFNLRLPSIVLMLLGSNSLITNKFPKTNGEHASGITTHPKSRQTLHAGAPILPRSVSWHKGTTVAMTLSESPV